RREFDELSKLPENDVPTKNGVIRPSTCDAAKTIRNIFAVEVYRAHSLWPKVECYRRKQTFGEGLKQRRIVVAKSGDGVHVSVVHFGSVTAKSIILKACNPSNVLVLQKPVNDGFLGICCISRFL